MKKIIPTALLLFIAILVFACKKDTNSLGLNLQNEYLGNAFMDTTSIVAYSFKEDRLITSRLANSIVIAGDLVDPVFGRTQSSFYLQYALGAASAIFGGSPVLDSVVLILQYSGYYGDTTDILHLEVYELSEALRDTTYYSDDSHSVYSQNLTYDPNFHFCPKPTTKMMDSVLKQAHLRVRLSDEFGQNLLNNPSILESNSNLTNFLKGLNIRAFVSSGTGSLLYFNLGGTISSLKLYYTYYVT